MDSFSVTKRVVAWLFQVCLGLFSLIGIIYAAWALTTFYVSYRLFGGH